MRAQLGCMKRAWCRVWCAAVTADVHLIRRGLHGLVAWSHAGSGASRSRVAHLLHSSQTQLPVLEHGPQDYSHQGQPGCAWQWPLDQVAAASRPVAAAYAMKPRFLPRLKCSASAAECIVSGMDAPMKCHSLTERIPPHHNTLSPQGTAPMCCYLRQLEKHNVPRQNSKCLEC